MLDFADTEEETLQIGEPAVRPSRLSLEFSSDADGRTYLDRQFAGYPFHVCRPHYFPHDAPGQATLYIQSSAGGIYQEDAHDLRFVAGEGTRAHVTTQASTIVHGMERGGATQRTSVTAGPGSHVEVVPDPLILFPSSRLSTTLTILVHESATAIVADSFLIHDPQSLDGSFESFEARTLIEDMDGTRLATDRFRISGRDVLAETPGITGSTRAQGLLMVIQRANDLSGLLERLRAELAACDDVFAGVSELPNNAGVWLRMLAPDGAALRGAMMVAWASASEAMTGIRPLPRRK